MILSRELKVNIDTMKVEVDVTTVPKMVLISGGKVKEIDLPHHGEFVVKIVQGRIQKYEKKEGELF